MTPTETKTETPNMMETALFAAGCFWGIEDAFRRVAGVYETAVGYIGGTRPHPTYEEVCGGGTGHAEAVRVAFDPARVRYEQLLDLFWQLHDPTQIDRQGPDVGSQYRSAIFTTSPAQKAAAQAAKAHLEKSGRHARPIATQIEDSGEFWLAEEYHQQYAEKCRGQPGGFSCRQT